MNEAQTKLLKEARTNILDAQVGFHQKSEDYKRLEDIVAIIEKLLGVI